jgi:hypothetical protein
MESRFRSGDLQVAMARQRRAQTASCSLAIAVQKAGRDGERSLAMAT